MNDKKAAELWERFRRNIRQGSPVNYSETPEEKKKRILELEADPEKWKKFYFPNYFKYPSPPFHNRATRRLITNFLRKKRFYEVRSWARGLAKSTLTMMDVLYLVLTGKLKFIVLTSSTYDAAEKFLTKYQCQLDSNQRIINDYGKQELPGSWTMGDFTTRNSVRFLAVGARQSPRGQSNDEIRPDCIIADDFDTDEECRNPDIINQKWSWFEEALMFTVDVAEPYLIIWNGNVIAEDCCVVRAGRVADHWEVINIRDANGVSVWPQKNKEADIDYLLEKASYEAGQKEYYNNPIQQGQVFKEMTFGACPPLEKLPFVVIYADPATSNKDRPSTKSKAASSTKVVCIVGSPDGINFYVYKCFVDAVKNSTFIGWLYECHMYVAGKVEAYVYIENNTLQDPFYEQVLLPLIYQEGKERGYMLPIKPDERKKSDKYVRIEANLEPLNRMGHLLLNERERENPHMQRMVSQFKSVRPNSKTMDGPDAVEGGVTITKEKRRNFNPGSMALGVRKSHSKRF